MTGGIAFGATITGGIQDVAGLLPLLGTEQCEEHIGSALTGGYLYSAAAPMSLFGSLGVARAGFKTLIACMSGRTWSGAKILANMGFEPKGINLSLVMIDKNDKDGRHLVETRLDELMKELHVDKSRVTISHKCTRWNIMMIILTAFLSSLSMIPYIHVNLRGSNLTHFSQWTFPILRAAGGFLTASMMQIVIERRISRLAASHLTKFNKAETFDHGDGSLGETPSKTSNAECPPVIGVTQTSHGEVHSDTGGLASHGIGDVEKGLSVPDTSDPAIDNRPPEGKPGDLIGSQHDTASGCSNALDWIFLILLLTGILSSVVGYVGCFSVVQNTKSHTGPLSWLGLEAGLSVIRMILWGLNPKGDDAPPLELILRLDHSIILPTCNLDDAHILQGKVLPLTRSNQFLNMITSFAGLVERFTHPDLTLYYTLTRKQTVISPQHSDEAEAGKRVLYITLFDHKERTTRVYTQDGSTEHFYSTESDVPLIDLRHSLLETKLDNEIISEDDPIAGDPEIHSLLQTHYQSLMDQIHFSIGESYDRTTSTSHQLLPAYTIKNQWTMKAADTVRGPGRNRREETVKQGLWSMWGSTVERGRMIEVDSSQPTFERDRLYYEHRRIEEMRQSLDAARGRWIDKYMESVTRERREATTMRRVDGDPPTDESVVVKKLFGCDEGPSSVVVEEGLIDERSLMEKLLVYEAEAWEGLVWNRVKEFMARNDVPESGKELLTREWRRNCWKRLSTNIRAMDARMERVKAEISALPSSELQHTLTSRLKSKHDEIQRDWQSIIERLIDTPTPLPLSSPGSRFNGDVQKQAERINSPGRSSGRSQKEQEHRQHQEMARRLEKELADVEFRIEQGLDRCDQFFDDLQLLECRRSRSKELFLRSDEFKAHLNLYSRELKGNNDVIHIDFICDSDQEYAWFAETLRDMPSVTSVWVDDLQRLPRIQRDTPLFINAYFDSKLLGTFLNSDQSLTLTHHTYVFIQHTSDIRVIAVSFVGPSSGKLILRLKHCAHRPDMRLTVLGTSFTLAVPESLTIDVISLRPIGKSPFRPSFVPDTRNHIFLQTSNPLFFDDYTLQDLQLLEEEGNLSDSDDDESSDFHIPIMPDDDKSWDFDALHGEFRALEPQQESPSSGHELLADTNFVAEGDDATPAAHRPAVVLSAP